MKTMKLFMLLAAVLLSSASAFAQSGNSEPLKGDVNEDGTVDVADMVSILKIMKDAGGAVGEKQCYWYAGVNGDNAVTGDNFTSVASRIAESAIPETGTVAAAGQYVYFVMPDTKRLASLVGANGSSIDFECSDAFGYHIYKTANKVSGTVNYTVEQIVYYWYVGQTDPSTMTSISPIVTDNSSPGWRLIGTTLPTYTISNPLWDGAENSITTGQSRSTVYVALPNSTLKVRVSGGDIAYANDQQTKQINGVTYSIYKYTNLKTFIGIIF